MKFVLTVGALLIASFIGVHTVLQNGSFLRYLDAHPDPARVPPIEFVVGQTYYIFSDLQNSATYFLRISERYPESSYADDAYFNYLQSLDDMNTARDKMAEAYQTYIDRFPKGAHAQVVVKRIEFCRNAR